MTHDRDAGHTDAREETMTTHTDDETSADTNTRSDDPRELGAAVDDTRGNWLVLFTPDGTITVAPMPTPGSQPEELAARPSVVHQFENLAPE